MESTLTLMVKSIREHFVRTNQTEKVKCMTELENYYSRANGSTEDTLLIPLSDQHKIDFSVLFTLYSFITSFIACKTF